MAMCLTEELGDKAGKLPNCKLVEVFISAEIGFCWGKMAFYDICLIGVVYNPCLGISVEHSLVWMEKRNSCRPSWEFGFRKQVLWTPRACL